MFSAESTTRKRTVRAAISSVAAILALLLMTAPGCRPEQEPSRPDVAPPSPAAPDVLDANGEAPTEPAAPDGSGGGVKDNVAPFAAADDREGEGHAATSPPAPGQIELLLEAPSEATAGDDVTIGLIVSNTGDTSVGDLFAQARLLFGLRDTITDGRLESRIPHLPPGGTARVANVLHTTTAGTWQVHASVDYEDELLAEAAATIPIDEAPQPEPEREEPVDLGPPLVDYGDRLQRLDPAHPVWVDPEGKAVLVVGMICQRQVPLELFACLRRSKEHESIVVVDTKAFLVHAGLLAIGLEPGHPVQFHPEYVPAEGPEVDITVVWEDEQGERQRARAQEWVRRAQDGRPMDLPWVFTGSQFLQDEQTGDQYYYADSTGELICVSNFPASVLDLPVRSSSANESLLFEAFTERIPPLGTPVTLILTAAEQEASDTQVEAVEAEASDDAPQTPEDLQAPAEGRPNGQSESPPETGAASDAESSGNIAD